MGMWVTAYTFAYIFMCRIHVQTLFTDLRNMAVKCLDTYAVAYSHLISDFTSDALIILIPIPFVSNDIFRNTNLDN